MHAYSSFGLPGLKGQDVAGQAQTGTGKTLAFLVATFTTLLNKPREGEKRYPRAIIMAPTRELAIQIANDAELLADHCDTLGIIYGARVTRVNGRSSKKGSIF